MRKVFLDDLPKWEKHKGKGGGRDGTINWLKSIGYKIRFVYNNIKGIIKIIDYISSKSELKIEYNNKYFYIGIDKIKKCQLGRILEIYTSEFKIEIGTRFQDDKRDIVITTRAKFKDKNGHWRKYYKYKCYKCRFECGENWSIKEKIHKDELWILESDLIKGTNCSCCGGNRIVVKDINSIYYTDKWIISYIGEECAKIHKHGSNEKVQVTCPDCGRVKVKNMSIDTIYNNHSIGCSCGDGYSYGHKYIYKLLTQLNQKFIDNQTFDWCKFYNTYKQKEVSGEYDFVLENINLIIEMDGGFHRKDNNMSGQTKEESKFLDDEKDRLASEYGYKVVRISDEGDIKQNILDSDLSKLFDISNIDWLKCEAFALSNRVKEACLLKGNNPTFTTGDIAKIMNIHCKTICEWLKKGNDLDWCYYNAKEELNKIGKQNGKTNRSIPIKMFDINMKLIMMFFNSNECSEQSEQLFKIKLCKSDIRKVCLGTQNEYKGYIFENTTKEEYQKWIEQKNKLKLSIHSQELAQAY